MLKLIPENSAPENPTVLIRWCIEKSDRDEMLQLGASVPHVLMVVAYENGAEDRYLRPLDEAMAHVGFRFPGTHKLFARVVWTSDMKMARAKMFDRANSRQYENWVLDAEADQFRDSLPWFSEGCTKMKPAETLQVAIDKRYFASEPPKWVRWWVNLPYDNPPRDQCAFRKRAVLAFTLMPFAITVFCVIGFLVSLASLVYGVLFLARGLHPLTVFKLFEPNRVLREVNIRGWERRYSYWSLEDSNGRSKKWRLLLTPFAGLVYFAVIEFFHRRTGMGRLEVLIFAWNSVIGAVMSRFGAIVFVLVLVAAIGLIINLLDRRSAHQKNTERRLRNDPKYMKELLRKEEEERRNYLETALRHVTCSTQAKAVNIAGIPLRKRTFRLYFQETKRKVCRFYAG